MTAPTLHKQSHQWLEQVCTTQPNLNKTILENACHLSEQIASQTITPYANSTLTQGMQIADILLDLDCDSHTIAAAILYPGFYYGQTDKEALCEDVGNTVYKLLTGTQRMESTYNLRGENQNQAQLDNLRKMFLAIVDDIRVVLIKLAEQLAVLMNIKNAPQSQKAHIAQQVMDMYAPLANRLGVGQLKWQLEDYAFRYLSPDIYKKISKALKMRRTERENFIQEMIERLTQLFEENKIKNFEIAGRAKHIYSIHKKIQRKRVSFEEIYDASALRVLVDNLDDCYSVLGIVHATWEHIAKEFDDYVTNPKSNGYQSIHTAVIGPSDINVEIQIRTRQMHEDAEMGVAAHWKYKEGSTTKSSYEDKIAWMREVMNWQKEISGDEDESLSKIFDDRIYVFTPAGDVYDLIAGATPLDFAYHVHSSVGHRCKGTKVNGKMVQLTYTLKTGDQVEIITSKQEHPSRDWLNPEQHYLKTPGARAKVRQWFKKQNFEHDFASGEEIWEKAYKRDGFKKSDCEKVVQRFNFKTTEQLIAAIGAGNIGITSIVQQLKALEQPTSNEADEENVIQALKISSGKHKNKMGSQSHINIEGIDACLTQMAGCCNPIPGDDIIGYITQGSGITIHQRECNNIQHSLLERPHRIIEVSWDNADTHNYKVDLNITAQDRQGLVRDITSEITQQKIPLLGLSTRVSHKENLAYLNLSVELHGNESLQKLQSSLLNISGVIQVQR